MAFYFVSTFAIAQTPTKQPALRLSRTKNLHFAKAPFPGFSAGDELYADKLKTYNVASTYYAKTLLKDMYHKKVAFNKHIENESLNFVPYEKYGSNEIEERQKLLFDMATRIWIKPE